MSYIRLSDSHYPVTLDAIRQANPNTGIPDDPTDASLNPLGYAVVTTATKPTTTADQVAELATTPDSNNTLQWTVRDLTPEETSNQRIDMVTQINDMSENARNKHITPGNSQAIVYKEKLEEAKNYKSNPDAHYPLLNAESNATGLTLEESANNIIAMHNQWIRRAAEIEEIRRGAKTKIFAAKNLSDAQYIFQEALTQLDHI